MTEREGDFRGVLDLNGAHLNTVYAFFPTPRATDSDRYTIISTAAPGEEIPLNVKRRQQTM